MISPPATNTPTNNSTGPIHDINRIITGHSAALSSPKTNDSANAAGRVGIGAKPDGSSVMPPRMRSSTMIASADKLHSTRNSTSTRTIPLTVRISVPPLVWNRKGREHHRGPR